MKTNAMRILDQLHLEYEVHTYAHHGNEAVDGVEVAYLCRKPVEQVFKTLVVQGKSKNYYVFMVPVQAQLDLKKAAAVAHEKSVDMIAVRQINQVTGYIRGGCSPLAMKKSYPTFCDKSALDQATICFSGGQIGLQIETSPQNLEKAIQLEFYPIVAEM